MNFNSYFTIKHTSNLRILLLTLFFIVPLGTIYGQNQLITIAGKNITLLKAFDAIESQTQLSITYSRTKIDVNRTLSVDFKKQKLSIVLDKLLAGTGFTYKIEKGYIVLVPVPVKQEQTEATSKKIQGVIVDTNGDPVIGASIQEKGVAGKGTVSDLDGKFNLSVASNAVLLISYIGFQSLEVKVGNRTSLSLVLKEDHQLLDEVVVIGYGTMEKRAVTSSITSISSKDLVTGLGGSTIATALKGKISGMNVSETSSPNASASFQLRGVASINASSSPLIVIDGIPGGDLRSISQEDIQSIDVLKDASAGASTAMYSSNSMWPYNGTWITSYGPARNVNNDLHWEKKAELNIGLDYAFLNNRLFGKFDIYKRRVSGMLYNISVPNPPAVYEKTTMNYGNLENTGWEFEIGGVPVKTKDFNWTTTMRLSHSSSKITSLWGNNTYQDRVGFPSPGTNGSAGRIEAGTKIGSYYIWKYAGITDNGRWLLYDKNDNVILSDKKTYDDKRYIGNAIPALMVSWDHTFTYKNLSLGINLRSWIDFDVFNTINMYYGLSEVAGQNVLRNAYIDNRHIKEVKQLCDYWLEDGTFLKIDAISLGYSLNMKKWQKYIDKIDLYLTVRNVACFTKYSGLNPEVNVNGLDPGYEWFNNIYPETRRYTVGMKIQF